MRHSVPKPTALIVNFPSESNGVSRRFGFLHGRWSLSRGKHDIWILSDLAYAEIYFGDVPPPSILQVPGRA